MSASIRATCPGNTAFLLDPNAPEFFEHAAALADAAIVGDGPFEESARDLLTALLLHEAVSHEDP
jgi:hypothetical protein